jgi:hypothetical protein
MLAWIFCAVAVEVIVIVPSMIANSPRRFRPGSPVKTFAHRRQTERAGLLYKGRADNRR